MQNDAARLARNKAGPTISSTAASIEKSAVGLDQIRSDVVLSDQKAVLFLLLRKHSPDFIAPRTRLLALVQTHHFTSTERPIACRPTYATVLELLGS